MTSASRDMAPAPRRKDDQPQPIRCRIGCGACCIAPSISSPIPGMPTGKPAGMRCVQLTADNRCRLFGYPGRPAVCVRLRPDTEMCGSSAAEAMAHLAALEERTRPAGSFHSEDSEGAVRPDEVVDDTER